MKTSLSMVALLSCISVHVVAQSCNVPVATCDNPVTGSYAPEPCFPTTKVCYPTNYYAAQDQGQFSAANGPFAAQLSAKCQATCSSNTQCASYVGIFNAAADSNLATGTCFYYSVQQVYPRQCADSPSGIIAYYKQKICPTTTTTTTAKQTTKSTTTTSKSTTTTKPSSTLITTTSSTTTKSTTTSSTTSSSTTSSSTTSSSTTSSSTTSSSTTTTSSTTTKATTTSSTTSSTTTSSAATITFSVSASGSTNVASGTILGDFLDGDSDNEGYARFTGASQLFGLDPQNHIFDVTNGNFANISPGPNPSNIYFNLASDIIAYHFVFCTGTVNSQNKVLSISCGKNMNVPSTTPDGTLNIGSSVPGGSSAVTLIANIVQ